MLTILTVLNNLICIINAPNNFTIDYTFTYSVNWLGLALFYAGVIVGIVVAFLLDVKTFFTKITAAFSMFFFYIIIWLFVNDSNILNLFLYYELFLLPSFFIVYFLSPNRRSILASIYFLTWTQFGSLLVLIGILRLYSQHGIYEFVSTINIIDTFTTLLILIGFGIKIPMWPFYYWLTKTHVEASSFFSIYLSGFLVKTAVYLFVKFYSILNTFHLGALFLSLFVVGIIDSSIKMWHQVDLKKLIAYTTVQEMNLLVIPVLFNDYAGELIIAFFIITHCILSSLLFLYIDIMTKRLATRASTQVSGLVHTMPTFTFLTFITWLGFTGLPYTIKFTLEMSIFTSLLTINSSIFLVLIFSMNVIGLIGFTKNLFNSMFGAPILNQVIIYDLTKREFALFLFLLINLGVINTLSILF